MIDPKPAIQPQQPKTSGSGTVKKRRFGGTEAQIRSALKFYKVMAYLTGAMLLLLCAELVARIVREAEDIIAARLDSMMASRRMAAE